MNYKDTEVVLKDMMAAALNKNYEAAFNLAIKLWIEERKFSSELVNGISDLYAPSVAEAIKDSLSVDMGLSQFDASLDKDFCPVSLIGNGCEFLRGHKSDHQFRLGNELIELPGQK